MLRKEPQGRDVAPSDAFTVNDSFASKLFKIRIGTVSAQVRAVCCGGGGVCMLTRKGTQYVCAACVCPVCARCCALRAWLLAPCHAHGMR